MTNRLVTLAAYDKPGVKFWHSGGITWVKFLDADSNRYSTNGTPLAGAMLTYAQAIEAGLPAIAPANQGAPVNWYAAANSH
jgi:hypothetical protein